MSRRRREGMDDWEIERRMEEIEDRRVTSDPFDDIIVLGFVVIVVIALIAAGLGWVDHQLGWGLKDWFLGLLNGLFKR